MKLLTTNNPKTMKGEAKGYLTGILHLAPSDLSGYQVCPMAKKAGCEAPCLNTAGRGAFSNVQKARIARTRMYFEERDLFLALLHKEISNLDKLAQKKGMKVAIRLNGTSDLNFYSTIKAFPKIQFYDYTKIKSRIVVNPMRSHDVKIEKGLNHSITYSLGKYDTPLDIKRMVKFANIAVVFREKYTEKTWNGIKVIDGDSHDLRFLDPKNRIVALTAKGKAKKDYSGFVQEVV
jgi:hypothetical protein